MLGRTVGNLRIVAKLGEGGMGVVYRAEDLRLGRPVALKLLAAGALGTATDRLRFEHEARAAAALRHPSICPIYAIEDVDGQPMLAMAYLEAETARERALEHLQRAIELGFASREWIMHDRDLDPLRADPRFTALLARLA